MYNCKDSLGTGKPQSFFFSFLRLGSQRPLFCECQQKITSKYLASWTLLSGSCGNLWTCRLLQNILHPHSPHVLPYVSGAMLKCSPSLPSPEKGAPGNASADSVSDWVFSHHTTNIHQPFLSWMCFNCLGASTATISFLPGLSAVFILDLLEEATQPSLKTDTDIISPFHFFNPT